MKRTKVGQDLIKGMEELIDHARGKITLRTSELEIPEPPKQFSKTEIAKIRHVFRVSQSVFARMLNVDDATVRAWEQGRNTPSGGSARLLEIAKRDPDVFRRLIDQNGSSSRRERRAAEG